MKSVLLITARFDPESVLRAIQRYRVTVLAAVSTQFVMMLNSPAIAPRGECRSNNDVFRALADGMGFDRELFPDDDQLVRDAIGSERRWLVFPDWQRKRRQLLVDVRRRLCDLPRRHTLEDAGRMVGRRKRWNQSERARLYDIARDRMRGWKQLQRTVHTVGPSR